MAKETDFTQRLIICLLSAISDGDQTNARVIAETLAKEQGVPLPADWGR